jgi:hypothetical protein
MFIAMFGGGMVPLLFMPGFMKALSNFSPVKWSILALEGSIWRGFTLGEMIVPCAVLIGLGAVCLAIGARVSCRGPRIKYFTSRIPLVRAATGCRAGDVLEIAQAIACSGMQFAILLCIG